MNRVSPLLAPCAALLLGGCVVKTAVETAVGVATLPVRVASKGIDLATTSQAEADQKRGREMRRREARLGELERAYTKAAARCAKGESASCTKADSYKAEIDQLLPTVPLERD